MYLHVVEVWFTTVSFMVTMRMMGELIRFGDERLVGFGGAGHTRYEIRRRLSFFKRFFHMRIMQWIPHLHKKRRFFSTRRSALAL